jgi:broad specificity phosphatase PhoE
MLDYLVLVRHGQAEHNVLYDMITSGKELDGPWAKLRNRSNRDFRLTRLGERQAQSAGKWLRENMLDKFTRAYVADLARTMETAANLGLSVKWWSEPGIREREYGLNDEILSEPLRDQVKETYREYLAHRDHHDFLFQFPGSESHMDHIVRASLVYEPFHWGREGESAIMVTSEGTIWALRIRIERMQNATFRRLIRSSNPRYQIHNGQVLVYTVIDPRTGERSESFSWMKSICPWNPAYSYNAGRWKRIIRPEFSNEDLLRLVERIPQIIE